MTNPRTSDRGFVVIHIGVADDVHNQLQALIAEVEAQRDKKIPAAAADTIIAYVNNILAAFP